MSQDINRRNNRQFVIDSNKPYYQQHDLQPLDAGKPLFKNVNATKPNQSKHVSERVQIQGENKLNPIRSNISDSGKIPAHVGVHDDQKWFDDRVVGQQQPVDNNDFVNVDEVQGIDPLSNFNEENIQNEDIKYKKYTVLIDGEVICDSDKYDEIIYSIETLMIEHNISINKIVLLKKMDLTFGLNVS